MPLIILQLSMRLDRDIPTTEDKQTGNDENCIDRSQHEDVPQEVIKDSQTEQIRGVVVKPG
jgi:hypothetical protein